MGKKQRIHKDKEVVSVKSRISGKIWFILNTVLLIVLFAVDRYLGYLNSTSPNWSDIYDPMALPLLIVIIVGIIISIITSIKSKGVYRIVSILCIPLYVWLSVQHTIGLIFTGY